MIVKLFYILNISTIYLILALGSTELLLDVCSLLTFQSKSVLSTTNQKVAPKLISGKISLHLITF